MSGMHDKGERVVDEGHATRHREQEGRPADDRRWLRYLDDNGWYGGV